MSRLDLDYFETIIVYKALTDETYLSSIIDYLNPIFFKKTEIKNVFEIIKDFFVKRGCCPTLTEIKSYLTTDELKTDYKKVVSTFSDIDKNLNVDELNQNTETFLKEKAVFHTMMEVVEDLNKNKVDTSSILGKFEKACNVSLTTNAGHDLFTDVDALVEDLNSDVKCISSGWDWLDEKLSGGFLESGRALYIFTGETNIGKSIFLGNVAINIANQGKSVLLISLEMPEMIYAQRLSSNITKIPLSRIKTDTSTLKHSLETHALSNPNARILIKEFPPSTITISYLQAYIKKLINITNLIRSK
jgi:replicative DNA helicase